MTKVVEYINSAIEMARRVDDYARALTKAIDAARPEGVVVFVRLNGSDDLVELRSLEIETMARCGKATIQERVAK